MRKMKKIVLSIILCLSFKTYGNSSKISSYKLKKIIKKESKRSLMKSLREIEKISRPNRTIGSVGHKKMQEYLFAFMTKLCKECVAVDEYMTSSDVIAKRINKNPSVKSATMAYLKSSSETIKLKNFYFTNKGFNANDFISVVVNYDSLNIRNGKINTDINTPAARNNSSSLVIALNMLSQLEQFKFERSILLAFVDAGRFGEFGQQKYLQFLEEKKLSPHFVLELKALGHDTKNSDITKKTGNYKLYPLNRDLKSRKTLTDLLAKSKKITSSIKIEIQNDSKYFVTAHKSIPYYILSYDRENDPIQNVELGGSDFAEMVNQTSLYNMYKFLNFGVLGYLYGLDK